MTTGTTDNRRKNLRLWIDTDQNSRGNVSEWCDYYSQFIDPAKGDSPLTPSFVRQLVPQDQGPAPRNIGERLARKLERVGGLPDRCLDDELSREQWERWSSGDKQALRGSGVPQAPSPGDVIDFSRRKMAKEKSSSLYIPDETSYLKFDRYTVPVSAGPGAEAPVVEEFEGFDVALWWARLHIGSIDTNRIKVVACRGTSMSPTIPDGSMVFVDISQRTHCGDGIYVINIAGRLLLKRINLVTKSRTLEVVSDNPLGPAKEVYGLHEEEQIMICGKVVAWMAVGRPD